MNQWALRAEMLHKALIFLVVASSLIVLAGSSRKEVKAQTNRPIEVFQVLELPLVVHEASLLKSEKGYFLRLSLANSAELKMIGLRYSLIQINSDNHTQIIISRTEGFSLAPYASKNLVFKTPIKLKPRDGELLVLMLEQVVSHEYIWEVIKAKHALEAYANGNYSVMPAVMRVANAVDSPPIGRMPFEE